MSAKVTKTPHTVLYPVPPVLVTSVGKDLRPNIVTIAWTGTANSVPPMVYVSIRPERYSYDLIRQSGEYVINIPSVDLAKAVDLCGMISGRTEDKFAVAGLTPVPASKVKPPLIKECPVNIECQVKQVVELGSHHMFIGEIVAVNFNQDVLNEQGRLDIDLAKPLTFCANEYRQVREKVGTQGFSKKG